MQGEELEVLFEGKILRQTQDKVGYWIGHAGNYYLVKHKAKLDLENRIVKIKSS